MILLLLLLAAATGGSHGQFPRVCTTKEALESKRCCPSWNGSPCGTKHQRGRCLDWVLGKNNTVQYYDDRLNWPRGYFLYSCECLPNYAGFDCGKCKFGYSGEKCDNKKVLMRKEIQELSPLERKRFFSYLNLAKYTTSKDYVILITGDRHTRETYQFIDATIHEIFSWIHYYSMKPILENSTFISRTNYAHQGPAFPGWHRRLLLFLEREIQELVGDENFTLPYYDWSNDTTCSICTKEFIGNNDLQGNIEKPSYFASWGAICSGYFYVDAYCRSAERGFHVENLLRKPGRDPTTRIPTYHDVRATLKWKKFDTEPFDKTSNYSFRNALEGFLDPFSGEKLDENMHNMFHDYIGGTMGQVPISANDPMFILHHGYVDKLFEVWIQRNNATPDTYPKNEHLGHQQFECAMPFFPCVTNKHLLMTSTEYGYEYSQMGRYLNDSGQQGFPSEFETSLKYDSKPGVMDINRKSAQQSPMLIKPKKILLHPFGSQIEHRELSVKEDGEIHKPRSEAAPVLIEHKELNVKKDGEIRKPRPEVVHVQIEHRKLNVKEDWEIHKPRPEADPVLIEHKELNVEEDGEIRKLGPEVVYVQIEHEELNVEEDREIRKPRPEAAPVLIEHKELNVKEDGEVRKPWPEATSVLRQKQEK